MRSPSGWKHVGPRGALRAGATAQIRRGSEAGGGPGGGTRDGDDAKATRPDGRGSVGDAGSSAGIASTAALRAPGSGARASGSAQGRPRSLSQRGVAASVVTGSAADAEAVAVGLVGSNVVAAALA
jgi:hypothetical protein